MKHFILDVDGVLTDGRFFYSAEGKIFKVFGPHDSDALNILKDHLYIHMITGDKRGFEITKKRVADDMGFPLDLVSTFERIDWLAQRFNPKETIYMGDGLFDVLVFDKVGYSIAPANAFYVARNRANFVTSHQGGNGAVAEACLHIMEKFFKPLDLSKFNPTSIGIWKKEENK